jgi:hypothetical protein
MDAPLTRWALFFVHALRRHLVFRAALDGSVNGALKASPSLFLRAIATALIGLFHARPIRRCIDKNRTL